MRLKSKEGYTLAELIVVMALTGLVFTAAFGFLHFSNKVFAISTKTALVQSELRLMLMYIKDELSSADYVEIIDSSTALNDYPYKHKVIYPYGGSDMNIGEFLPGDSYLSSGEMIKSFSGLDQFQLKFSIANTLVYHDKNKALNGDRVLTVVVSALSEGTLIEIKEDVYIANLLYNESYIMGHSLGDAIRYTNIGVD